MSRCYGCCQENCGYTQCSCSCHERSLPPGLVEHLKERNRQSNELGITQKFVDEVLAPPKCSCKLHPRYQAKRKPRSRCVECWRFYINSALGYAR